MLVQQMFCGVLLTDLGAYRWGLTGKADVGREEAERTSDHKALDNVFTLRRLK